eukprot:7291327-Prymnesium_polylepis.2
MELRGELRRQPVEMDKLRDALLLLPVAHARRVHLLDELRDVAEDGRVQHGAHDLAHDAEGILEHAHGHGAVAKTEQRRGGERPVQRVDVSLALCMPRHARTPHAHRAHTLEPRR